MATNVTRNTIFYLNRAFVSVFIENFYTIEENINSKLILRVLTISIKYFIAFVISA